MPHPTPAARREHPAPHLAELFHVVDTDAHEGPVYVAAEDALYFTTVPRPTAGAPDEPLVSIKRLALDGLRFPLAPDRVTVIRSDANAANGMALDLGGDLIVCEQGNRRRDAAITRLDRATGEIGMVVDRWRGLPLNSPNDVIVGSDAAIWFTDPSYGYLQGFRPEPRMGDCVYRFDRDAGEASVVAAGFDKPNGIALSPDERTLFVTDSGANQEPGSYHPGRPHHIKAFDVSSAGLSGERVFAEVTPGFPDGIKTDSRGCVYSSSSGGVQVFDPAGDAMGTIRIPGGAAPVNFTFGGPDRNVLFITTDSAVWAAVLDAEGE